MENVLYQKIIVLPEDSEDKETATLVCVTEEANGYGVFLNGYNGTWVLAFFAPYGKNEAIEFGVEMGKLTEAELIEAGMGVS